MNLDFAENGNEDEPLGVDLLIGSDVYWEIVTGESLEVIIDLWPSTPTWAGSFLAFTQDENRWLEEKLQGVGVSWDKHERGSYTRAI